MRISKGALLAAAVVAGFLAPSPARATPITEDLSFTLTGFVDFLGTNVTPPIPMITGSITVTYDPMLVYHNDTTHIVVHSLTGITVGSPLGFEYGNGFLEFGGTQNDVGFVVTNTNDLVVSFNVTDPLHPTFVPCSTPGYTCGIYTGSNAVDAAGYTQIGYNTAWFYGAQSSVSPTLTPEPSTIALLGTGMSFLAIVRRRAKLISSR